jgi:hypothetical protein
MPINVLHDTAAHTDQVQAIIEAHGGDLWRENTDFPVDDWRHEALANDTRVGYWEYVALKLNPEGADVHTLSVEALLASRGPSIWDDHPAFTPDDWRFAVKLDDTRLGYWPWVLSHIQQSDTLIASKAEEPLNELSDLVESMPSHGNRSDDPIHLTLLQLLTELQNAFEAIEPSDLVTWPAWELEGLELADEAFECLNQASYLSLFKITAVFSHPNVGTFRRHCLVCAPSESDLEAHRHTLVELLDLEPGMTVELDQILKIHSGS